MKEKENGIRIRCAEVNGKGSDVDNWNQCKMALNKKLINVCAKSCPYCTAKRRVLEVRTTKLVCLQQFPWEIQQMWVIIMLFKSTIFERLLPGELIICID